MTRERLLTAAQTAGLSYVFSIQCNPLFCHQHPPRIFDLSRLHRPTINPAVALSGLWPASPVKQQQSGYRTYGRNGGPTPEQTSNHYIPLANTMVQQPYQPTVQRQSYERMAGAACSTLGTRACVAHVHFHCIRLLLLLISYLLTCLVAYNPYMS